MSPPSAARRTALTLVSAAMLGLALVLGLWQQVDRSCDTADRDPREPLAACEPVPLAEDDTPQQVPPGETLLEVRTAAN